MRIEDPEFMGYLRREFPKHGPTFFVSKVAKQETFILCGWCQEHRGIFVELIELGSVPRIDKKQIHELRMLIDPPQAAESAEGYFDPKTGQTFHVFNAKSFARAQDQKLQKDLRDDDELTAEAQDLKTHMRKHVNTKTQDHPFFTDVKSKAQRKKKSSATKTYTVETPKEVGS